MPVQIIFSENHAILFKQAARVFFTAIRDDVSGGKEIVVGLSGGGSIIGMLEALKEERVELSSGLWKRLHFFLVDERLVDLEDSSSNFRLLNEVFFREMITLGVIEEEQLHPCRFEPRFPDRGVERYGLEFQRYGNTFDIAILGVGEDGHVGALFPQHHSIESVADGFITMDDSPKPPPMRMSSSLKLITRTPTILAFFIGPGKAEALRRYFEPMIPLKACPVKLIDQVTKAYLITDISKNAAIPS